MSAKRLGRIAGLVLVLAMVFGGIGSAGGDAHDATTAEIDNAAQMAVLTDVVWG